MPAYPLVGWENINNTEDTALATGTLIAHKGAQLVTLDELSGIPAGEPQGTRHKPVAHIEFASGVIDAFSKRGYAVVKNQHAVTKDGAQYFGVLDLKPTTGKSLIEAVDGGMAVGLRHSNDRKFSLGVKAGARIFVCDNLAFAGGEDLLRRKHTLNLDLEAEIQRGMDRAFRGFLNLDHLMRETKKLDVTDDEAKLLIYNMMMGDDPVIAPRHINTVHGYYFDPEAVARQDKERGERDLAFGFDDVKERNVFSVMNAVTRVTRTYGPQRCQDAGLRLTDFVSNYFQIPPYIPEDESEDDGVPSADTIAQN